MTVLSTQRLAAWLEAVALFLSDLLLAYFTDTA
jgi:hypothetical protein